MSIPALKLPATLEKFVAAQVEEGTYRSREAAIVAAVASAKRRADQRAWLRTELQKGLDSESAGPLNMEDVIRRGLARLAARKRRRSRERTKKAAVTRALEEFIARRKQKHSVISHSIRRKTMRTLKGRQRGSIHDS